jgi:hypothetical protein
MEIHSMAKRTRKNNTDWKAAGAVLGGGMIGALATAGLMRAKVPAGYVGAGVTAAGVATALFGNGLMRLVGGGATGSGSAVLLASAVGAARKSENKVASAEREESSRKDDPDKHPAKGHNRRLPAGRSDREEGRDAEHIDDLFERAFSDAATQLALDDEERGVAARVRHAA